MAAQPTQAQIDEAESLARMFGLTYLSSEGYAKLAALLLHVRCRRADGGHEIMQNVRGWRVG